MTLKRIISGVCLLSGGLFIFLFLGCKMVKSTQWVEGYLVTMYSIPRKLQVGEMQLALRVQDRNYRILPECAGSLEVIQQATGQRATVPFKAGLGKDVKGWTRFPEAGEYTVVFSFAENTGQTLSANFTIRIPARTQK